MTDRACSREKERKECVSRVKATERRCASRVPLPVRDMTCDSCSLKQTYALQIVYVEWLFTNIFDV